METAITITTIHNCGEFLEKLCRNIEKYGHEKEVSILIIGDEKTPPLSLPQTAVDIKILDILGQEARLGKFPELFHLFPHNTPDRVILGGMISYLDGCQRVIALDDDNWPMESDFVGAHSIAGNRRQINCLDNGKENGGNGWFNVHSLLIEKNNIKFYPRGFPFGERNPESSIARHEPFSTSLSNVIVNQGLVLGDPDIDAIQRLAHPIEATSMNRVYGSQFALYPGTWSPFNYQNTCLSRELIPCYYRPRSGSRNADIWTAYIFNRLAEHFGDVISFGEPLVTQIRNEHNLFDDLDTELQNNKESDYFCDVLRGVELTATTYFGALCELLDKVKVDDNHPMSKSFFEEYRVWCEVVAKCVCT